MATKRVNIDIVAKDKSQQALNKVRGNLDGVKKAVFNVRNALAGLGAGLVIRNLVNTGKEIEGLQVRLKFLFGSVEEGAKAFDKMAEFASRVPFSLQEIQAGSGNLAVVAKDADELANLMEITGNVAAATGLDFRTTAEQIQRSFSAGIGAADLFRDRGVRAMLGFKAGATVSIEETQEAFENIFGNGGKFAGTTDALAQTLEGTLSMIGDKVFTFKKTLLDAGFFAQLKKEFGDLDKFLQDNAKTLDDVAIKIGKGMAEAVKFLADAVVFVKNNFDSFVLVLEGLIALKVAKVLFGIQTAIAGMTISMNAFNVATKKNIIFASISTFVAGMGLLIHKFKQFKNEMNEQNQIILDNTSTITDYKNAITELTNKIADMENLGKVIDENNTPITALKATLELLNEEMEALKEVINETSNSTAALGKSLHGDFHTILKEGTKTLKEYTDGLVDMNIQQARLEDRQFGMSERDKDLVKEHTKFLNLQKETLSTINDHMRVRNKLTAEQAGLFTVDAIVEELKKEEQQYNRMMQVYQEHAMQRKRLSLETFRDEREQAKNNFHKMLDDALEFNHKKAQLEKQAKEHAISEGRSALQILAGMNRTAFAAFKAVRIAEATIDTYRAATAAFAKFGGFPLGAIAAAASVAKGLALVAQIKSTNFRAGGGSVNKDQAYMVGEKGAEMFVPSGSGKIVPNHQLSNGKPVTVNFNINTVDARGFNELLVNSRGLIVNMINSAVNEKGKMAIV